MTIEGVLLLSSDPPSLGFVTGNTMKWRVSSKDELTRFLIEVNLLEAGNSLPGLEYHVRLPGAFPKEKLAEFGLLSQPS